MEIYFHLDVSGTEKVSGLFQERPITKPFIKTRQITITPFQQSWLVSGTYFMNSFWFCVFPFGFVLCFAYTL